MNKLTTLLLTLGAGLCLAQPPQFMQTPTELKTYLGLSDTQVSSLNSIQSSVMQSAMSVMQQVQTKQSELEAALEKGSDAATLGKMLLDIQALKKQVDSARTSARTQALAVLTADQRTKLKPLEDAAKLETQLRQATQLNLVAPTDNGGNRMRPFSGRPPMPF